MSKSLIICAVTVLLAFALLAWRMRISAVTSDIPAEVKSAPPAAAPLCPWREPEADMKEFFPDADHYQTETRILSGLRVELAGRLGRTPTGDENVLRLYVVCSQTNAFGNLLTRRVKGTHGAVEIVLAVDLENRVRGIRLQRLREPEVIAAAVNNPGWLRSFIGKRAEDSWKLGGDIPDVSAEAHNTAAAIVEGVRSSLILLSVADESGVAISAPSHH
jgi:hypothetical protein